jgi:predicted deacylase
VVESECFRSALRLAIAVAFAAAPAAAQDYPVRIDRNAAPPAEQPAAPRPPEAGSPPPPAPATELAPAGAAPLGTAPVGAGPAPAPTTAGAGPAAGPDDTPAADTPESAATLPAVPLVESPADAAPVEGGSPAPPPPILEPPPGLTPTAAAVWRARAERAALPPGPQPITILETVVAPGSRADARWQVGESFDGTTVETPVVVVHGAQPGPRLCVTAGVHGDELNGVEVVRRLVNDTDPQNLRGTVIAVPIVNLLGFARGSRYLPDRRDLNRFFPGFAQGSAASRMAFSLFRQVIVHCDALVDFHTGSFDRSNLPQVRGDLRNDRVLAFTRGFGATPVLHSPGSRGMLRLAATDHEIPAVTFEVGAPYRLEPDKIDFGVQAIKTLMHQMGMTPHFRLWSEPQATFYESKWVRVDDGGMLFSSVELGDRVREGQRLGKVIDPIRNREYEIIAPFAGRVIGMALNQVVLPGFAAYHLGIETTEAAAAAEAERPRIDADPLETMEGDEMGPSSSEVTAPREEGDPDGPQE